MGMTKRLLEDIAEEMGGRPINDPDVLREAYRRQQAFIYDRWLLEDWDEYIRRRRLAWGIQHALENDYSDHEFNESVKSWERNLEKQLDDEMTKLEDA